MSTCRTSSKEFPASSAYLSDTRETASKPCFCKVVSPTFRYATGATWKAYDARQYQSLTVSPIAFVQLIQTARAVNPINSTQREVKPANCEPLTEPVRLATVFLYAKSINVFGNDSSIVNDSAGVTTSTPSAVPSGCGPINPP